MRRKMADDTISYLTVLSESNNLQEDINKVARWEENMQMTPLHTSLSYHKATVYKKTSTR